LFHLLQLLFCTASLPKKDKNDLFFDIEGDPTVEGGHEYLFGLINGSNKQFKSFWAKLPSEEEAAFRELMDFFKNQWSYISSFNDMVYFEFYINL